MREVHNVEDRLLEDLTYPEEAPAPRRSVSALARVGGHLLVWAMVAVVCYAAAL